MISRSISPAPRRKSLAEQETEFTSEGAPAPTEGARPAKPGHRGPNVSRVPTGIPGAHRRAPAGKRRVHGMAVAALLAMPLLASARDHDRDHHHAREDAKHRAGMSFNELARHDGSHSWHGDSWSSTSRWKFEANDDDDDERKGSRRWVHEAREHTSAVPEPGGAVLLLAGLAAIGFVIRRRRAD